MTPGDRKQLLDYILAKWEGELKNDNNLVEALRQAPFIDMPGGSMVQASSLYDPRSGILKEIFEDEPNVFPPPSFASTAWLKVGTNHQVTMTRCESKRPSL